MSDVTPTAITGTVREEFLTTLLISLPNHFHLAYHVCVLDCAVLERHGHLPVDDELGTNPELAAKGSWKPHSICLTLIDDIKANSRNVDSQQGADHKWNTPRQLGKHPHGLEF